MDGAVNLKQQKKPVLPRMKKYAGFYVLFLPVLAFLVVFHYLPMIGIYYSFTKYTIIKDPVWVGLANFERLFAMPNFWNAFQNTLELSVVKLLLTTTFSVVLSLLLNEMRNVVYKRTLQTLVYLPYFISWVALAGIFLDVLSMDGVVNQLITALGLEPVYFLGDERIFPYTMVVTDVWKNFGWNAIVYLAAITSVDPSLFEAAYLDGAGRFRQVLHVTLPTIMPIIMLTTILSIGNVLRAGFDQIFNLYSPLVYSTGDIIDTFIYRLGLEDFHFSPSAAVGLFNSIVNFFLVVIVNKISDKVSETSLW